MASYHPPPFGPASSLALAPLSNRSGISRSTPLHGPASSLALVPLSNRRGISRSIPLRGPSVLTSTRSSLHLMWDLTIHLLPGPSVLAGTPLGVHPLLGSAGISRFTPFQGPVSSLAHCSVSTPFWVQLRSHDSPLSRAQCPRWHTAQYPPPSGLNWDLTIHPFPGPSVLAGTPLCIHPLLGSASSLAHRPVTGSHTNCNSPSPRIANIVLFGLFLLDFHPKFSKHVY